MKTNLVNGIIPILMLMVLSSCTKYDLIGPYVIGPYTGIEQLGLTVENIELSGFEDRYNLYGVIPSEGIKFSMTPVLNEAIDIASLTEVSIDFVNQEPQGYALFNEVVKLFSGDWGKVEYLNASQPYNIEVTIYPNTSEHERDITLFMSGENDGDLISARRVSLLQKAKGQ